VGRAAQSSPVPRRSRSIESGDCTNNRQCRLELIEDTVLGGLREDLKKPRRD
jgi:hypothetical protein